MMYTCRGFPFTKVQLCKLAYQIAVAEKKTGFSPTKKRAGRSWLKYFYKRQLDLKKKVASNLLIGRAITANPGCIEKFFEDYSGWLKEWKLEYSPNSIWNVAECGIGDIPQMQKVIGVKGEQSFQTVEYNNADICFSWRIVIESYVNLQSFEDQNRMERNGSIRIYVTTISDWIHLLYKDSVNPKE